MKNNRTRSTQNNAGRPAFSGMIERTYLDGNHLRFPAVGRKANSPTENLQCMIEIFKTRKIYLPPGRAKSLLKLVRADHTAGVSAVPSP